MALPATQLLDSRAVPITSETLNTFLQRVGEEREDDAYNFYNVDITKEFRGRLFRLVQLILQNPLREMISTSPPCIHELESKYDSLLVLYASPCEHLRDDIHWLEQKKMNVKLILYDETRKLYKVKNAKTDEGTVIMRRRTWRDLETGWRRHEYKLYMDETYYKPQVDGTSVVHTRRTLSEFPALVHYFRKRRGFAMYLPHKKRQKVAEDSDKEDDATEDTMDTSSTGTLANNNDAGESAVATVTSSGNATGMPALSPLFRPFSTLASGTSAAIAAAAAALGIDNQFGSFSQEQLQQNEPLFQYSDYLSPISFLPPSPQSNLLLDTKSPIPSTVSESSPPLTIVSYAPDTAPASDFTRVLVVINTTDGSPLPTFGATDLKCIFDGQESLARVVAPNTVEIVAPPHAAGVAYFWLVCKDDKKNSLNSGDTSLTRSDLLYTNAVPFYFTPADVEGRLSLAYTLNASLRTPSVMARWRHTVRELDLSYNDLDSVDFLVGFYNLTTLVLDHNAITENTKFPCLPQLLALSLNNNRIRDIQFSKFIPNVNASFPKLQFLSTLGNTACPIFSSLPHRYYNYRIYVISCLPNLRHLDSSPVTEEERKHALYIRSQD